MYSREQFMNPGPAPRPPTDRPRLALTPNTSNTLPGNMAGLSMQSPAFNNGSQMSLIRTQTERSVSSTATVKEGMVKVKDEATLDKGVRTYLLIVVSLGDFFVASMALSIYLSFVLFGIF